ncbi:hypothetical protein [Capnocytophaga canimorsus]|uniref:hypothetical protein n=1 Tax=Capnocytophaga canimorsus TaxID=28188 RepID=UPI000BB1C185|nr:hypothetical protein [Capnocytophaga canimorsus]ATA76148.1 hypothetical protein CGC47_00255 [Capnocytophaga canimorsus]PJI80349.1 hypothetical protein CLV61_1203 [Capnocytophaga canimorsus]STA71256.1 Uncharacterised protein [Capnocytophaga canimorsus]
MSFGGHVLDMIKRTNANNALREKYRAKKDKTTNNRWKSEVNDKISEEKEISEEELERIKSAIRSKLRKKQLKQNILIYGICIALLFLLFFWVYFS